MFVEHFEKSQGDVRFDVFREWWIEPGDSPFPVLDEQVAVSAVGRKRPRNDSARTTAKRAHHSGVDKEPVIACQHAAQSFCNAALLTPDDLAANHRRMYGTSDKVTQDQFLTSLMSVSTASRPRVKDAEPSSYVWYQRQSHSGPVSDEFDVSFNSF